jgi:Phosphotransferase enzyme family
VVPRHSGGAGLTSPRSEDPTASLPDARLLSGAAERLRQLELLPEGEERWDDLGRRDLVRSTVRALAVRAGSAEPVRVFHKRIKPREGSKKTGIVMAELRESLAVAQEMENALASHLPPGVTIARTLAVDTDRLESVTLAVPGGALGALWRRSLTPASRRHVRDAVRLVGATCRVMEEHCGYEGELHDRLTGDDVVDRRLGRVADFFEGSEFQTIGETLTTLERAALEMETPVVRVHGDLNSTNVLVGDEGIGIIDFSWQARLRLSDLSHFAFRLEYESGSPPGFARELVGSLLDGYGDPQVTTTPAWRFLRYSKLLRVVAVGARSKHPLARWRARGARTELSGALDL